MKRFLSTIFFILVALITFAQTYTNTKQIRFYPITSAADTAATVANSGRGWYDFVSHKFRCNINGTNSDWTGSGSGGGGVTALTNGLTLSGSTGKLGGALTEPTTITGSSTNTIKNVFTSLGVTQTNGAGLWLSNTTAAAAGAQQISPSLVYEGQGWKTNATAESQSVKFSNDLLPVQGTTNPTAQYRNRFSINGAAYGSSLIDYWSDGRVSIGTSTPISSTTLTVDRFGGTNNNIVSFRSLGTAIWALPATSNVSHTMPATLTTSSLDAYTLSGTWSAATGNPLVTAFKASPTLNYTAAVSGAVMRGFVYEPTETSITGVQQLAFVGTKGAAVFGKSTVDASTTRVQITGTGTSAGYNLLTQDLSNNNRFGVQDNGNVFFFTTPSNDNALTQVIVRDSGTGQLKYRDASSITTAGAWNATGATAITTPVITGNWTHTGRLSHGYTETRDADARPVIDDYLFTVAPTSAPAITVDYHGIDYSMSTTGSNTNSNTNLYPLEVTAGHNATTTVGSFVNVFLNSRNTSTGTVTNMTGLRLRARNNTTGTISNYYGVRLNDPINVGTFTNWYGLYIDAITTPTNIWGIYSNPIDNYLGGVQLGAATTSQATFNIPHGTAPSSPVNGDVWSSTTGFYGRVNGTTISFGGISNTAAANEMAKSDGTNLVPSGLFALSASTLTPTVGNSLAINGYTPTSGNGGSVSVHATNAFAGGGGNGGALSLASGVGDGAGVGESIYINPGNDVIFLGTQGETGTGSIAMQVPPGGASANDGSSLSFTASNAYSVSGNGNGGSVNITAGQRRTAGSGTDGSIVLETLSGNGTIKINDGANEQMGVATLVGGTVTVNNSKITANTRIFLTTQTLGGTIGVQYISARSAGTSFTITSSSGTDTSTVAWLLIEPN